MDVNEHDILSNTYTQTQIKVKEQRLYCWYTVHGHSGVFKNENNSHPKMSVKRPQLSGSLYSRRETLHMDILVVLMLLGFSKHVTLIYARRFVPDKQSPWDDNLYN